MDRKVDELVSSRTYRYLEVPECSRCKSMSLVLRVGCNSSSSPISYLAPQQQPHSLATDEFAALLMNAPASDPAPTLAEASAASVEVSECFCDLLKLFCDLLELCHPPGANRWAVFLSRGRDRLGAHQGALLVPSRGPDAYVHLTPPDK